MIKIIEVEAGILFMKFDSLQDAFELKKFFDSSSVEVTIDSSISNYHKEVKELEQFKNLADDYNIPFDSFYYIIEDLLTEGK